MSTHRDNSFLPSGPFTIPLYNTSQFLSFANYHTPLFQDRPPMSPPKTRSASTDESIATRDDWCEFVQQLRSHFQGERANYKADRERMIEVMEGERELWERERQLWNAERNALKTRILDLETKLFSAMHATSNLIQVSSSISNRFPPSKSNSLDSFISINNNDFRITQESGRNADGNPFYAPVSHNPTRTFDTEIASDLRVDDIVAPRGTAIRVTSKKLTSSDFKPHKKSPVSVASVPGTISEAIDISHIQPELDSVAIRVSAVSPTFAAKVLSPQGSPSSSTNLGTMTREDQKKSQNNHDPGMVLEPENRRLTMFAGHTPNHSISKFDDCSEVGATITPTEAKKNMMKNSLIETTEVFSTDQPDHHGLCSDETEVELAEPLGLVNVREIDDVFLARVTEKLANEARKNREFSPASQSALSQEDLSSSPIPSGEHEEKCGAPILRMKPSMNFGKPFGCM